MSESQSRTATAVAEAVLIQRGLSYRPIGANTTVGLQICVGSVGIKGGSKSQNRPQGFIISEQHTRSEVGSEAG